MADSIRETIIAAFTTRLASMTVAGGYIMGAGASVFRATKNIDPGDLPASVILPDAEQAQKTYGQHECTMKISIQSLALYGSTNASVIQERLLADLKKCLFAMSVTISTYIDGIVYTGGGPKEVPNGEDTIAAAYVEFDVKYNETIGDPYSN